MPPITRGKRNHSATDVAVFKRQKLASSASTGDSHLTSSSGSSDESWEIAAIVTCDTRQSRYLVRWKSRDVNGKPYDDTWEPKKHLAKASLDVWEDWQSAHKGLSRRPESEFELLPAPHGWHLKGSPLSTQSLSQQQSQAADSLFQSQQESATQPFASASSRTPQPVSTEERHVPKRISKGNPNPYVLIKSHPVDDQSTPSDSILDSQSQDYGAQGSVITSSKEVSSAQFSNSITEDSQDDSQATFAPISTLSASSDPTIQQGSLSVFSNLPAISQNNHSLENILASTQQSSATVENSSPFVAGQLQLGPAQQSLEAFSFTREGDSQKAASAAFPSYGQLDQAFDSSQSQSRPSSPLRWPTNEVSMSERAADRHGHSSNRMSPQHPRASPELDSKPSSSQSKNRSNFSPTFRASTLDSNVGSISTSTASGPKEDETLPSPLLLPIEIAGEQRPPYVATITRNAHLMDEFLQGKRATDRKLADIFHTLRKIEDHADLISEDKDISYDIGSETQDSISQSELAQWHRHASSKFVLLEAIIQQIQYSSMSIAVFCRPGLFTGIIEAHLTSENIDWVRLSNLKEHPSSNTFKVIIIDADEQFEPSELKKVHMAIDFVPKELEEVRRIRDVLASHLQKIRRPFVVPVPVFSISHISYLPGNSHALTFSDLVKLTLRKLDQRPEKAGEWRRQCGTLPRGVPDAKTLGTLVGECVRENKPVVSIMRLQDIISPTTSQKRSREVQQRLSSPESEEESSKKQRVSNTTSSLQPTAAGQNAEHDISITHVTDTPAASHQRQGIFIDDDTATQIERERANYVAQEEAIAALQTRFEALGREKRSLEQLLKTESDAKAAAEARALKLLANLDIVREEKATLQAEVQETRHNLAESSVANLAELAQLREKSGKVEALERKIVRQEGDLDYIRKQYQAAGDGAVELARTNEELQQQNEQLQKRASEESVKLRELFQAHSIQAAHSEVKKKEQLIQRQDQLIEMLQERVRRQERQIKEMEEREEHRNGMALATRAGSRAGSAGPAQSRGLAPEHALRAALEGHRGNGRPGSRAPSRQSSPLASAASKMHANVPHQPSHLRNEP